MLKPFLKQFFDFETIKFIMNYIIYYPTILIAVLIALKFIHDRLVEENFGRNNVKKFIIVLVIAMYPAAILSAKMVNMFYYPSGLWSFNFFMDQLLHGRYTTFHGGLFLPFLLIVVLAKIYKIKFWNVMDAFFLYLPMSHAIGRAGCLLVGCCWGNELKFQIFGKALSFQNPVPIYSIILNLLIFYFLRNVYSEIHDKNKNHENDFVGLITALYLLLYGNVRLFLETIRKENIIFLGMTQAQVVMILFMFLGVMAYFRVLYRNK